MNFLPKEIKTKVKVDKNLLINAKKLICELNFEDKKAILVSDNNIFDNYSEFLSQNFIDYLKKTLILENAKANQENIDKILQNIEDIDLIIAFGSGTINDLCKFVSAQKNIPYIIFASAPSMNGYLSKNASIEILGHKKTLNATLPQAIFCDIDILKNAPKNMIKAGIGDSLCFYSCWFDWLLSSLLLETDFNHEVFALIFDDMSDFIANYHNLSLDDDILLEKIIKILLLSGASMTIAGSSNPASQSEHLIAHIYTMKYPKKAEKVLHGLQIATTTLTATKIQEELISLDFLEMREPKFLTTQLNDFLGSEIATQCQKEYEQKANLIKENHKFLQQELTQNWQDYCNILSKIILPENILRDIFSHFKIETGHKALDLEPKEYYELVNYAKFIRNRFTCLDL